MIVYVAGSSLELPRVRAAMDALRAAGIEVAHDWPAAIDAAGSANRGLTKAARQAALAGCQDGLREADALWLLVPTTPSIGCWVELGIADAYDREIFASGDTDVSIFLADFERYATDAEALVAITAWARQTRC